MLKKLIWLGIIAAFLIYAIPQLIFQLSILIDRQTDQEVTDEVGVLFPPILDTLPVATNSAVIDVKGYAQSAIQALLEIAFQQERLQQVWGKFLTTNEKMRHINVDKCGFKIEGILPHEYFYEGKYHDMIKVSMSADEYQQRRVKA